MANNAGGMKIGCGGMGTLLPHPIFISYDMTSFPKNNKYKIYVVNIMLTLKKIENIFKIKSY